MHAEVAERFICCGNRILLAGDAAHRFPPAGGFGKLFYLYVDSRCFAIYKKNSMQSITSHLYKIGKNSYFSFSMGI